MLTIQYANAFRRSGIHAHIKVNAATPWVHEGVIRELFGNMVTVRPMIQAAEYPQKYRANPGADSDVECQASSSCQSG
jgi:hypothetical protein